MKSSSQAHPSGSLDGALQSKVVVSVGLKTSDPLHEGILLASPHPTPISNKKEEHPSEKPILADQVAKLLGIKESWWSRKLAGAGSKDKNEGICFQPPREDVRCAAAGIRPGH